MATQINPYTMPTIPKQYWQPDNYQESQYNVTSTGTIVPTEYAKNKKMQIADFNAKLKVKQTSEPLMGTKDFEIEKSNIIGDLDTKKGVFFEEDKNQYTVVSNEDLGTSKLPPVSPKDKETKIRFADKSALGRLKDIFLGYSLEEKRRDADEIKKVEEGFQEETSYIETPEQKDSNIAEKLVRDASFFKKPFAYGIGKSAEVVEARSSVGSETSPTDILLGRTEIGETEKKYNVLKGEKEKYEKDLEGFNIAFATLEGKSEYKDNVVKTKELQSLQKKYTDKGLAGTESAYGEFDKEGNIVAIGDAMPEEDKEKFIALTTNIRGNFEKLKPEVEELEVKQKELESQRKKLMDRSTRFTQSYESKEFSKKRIQERDPFKAWENALLEELGSEEASTKRKVGDVLRLGALKFGKTLVRDPLQFAVTSPIDVLKEDIEEKRITKSDVALGVVAPPAKYVEYLARGIYDPKTESSFKFDPDALSGALTIGMAGAGVASGFAKTGALQVADKAIKASTSSKVLRSAIFATPAVIEGIGYARTPKEQRNIWQSVGRMSGSYGTLGAYVGAGYVGSKVGAAAKESLIRNYDLSKGLRSGEVKIKMYSKTEGVGFKEVKGLKNAKDVARITDRGKVYIETPYGKYQIRSIGAYENIGGKRLPIKTSERAPGFSEKIIRRKVKQEVFRKYNEQVGGFNKIKDFKNFDRILSSTQRSGVSTSVKNFYNQNAPEIKADLLSKAKGYTTGGPMYGTSSIHMDIRPVDAMGRPLGKWKSFVNVNSRSFDIFFKDPNQFGKIVDAQNAIEKYTGYTRKGNTYAVSKDSKTGGYKFTPIRQEGSFVIKDAGTDKVNKIIYYQSKVNVGPSVRITKDHYNRLLSARKDTSNLGKYLTKAQLEKTNAFYSGSNFKNMITFDNIQTVSVLRAKPFNINAYKYYYVANTKNINVINKGLPKGARVIRGDKLAGMKLGKNQVALEVNTKGMVEKVDDLYYLTNDISARNIRPELGTPYEKFSGVSATNIGPDSPKLFGDKGVATEMPKYYGRPSRGIEITDKTVKTEYLKGIIKKDLMQKGIRLPNAEIDKLVRNKILTIDPATGKVATTWGERAILQSKYGGDWSKLKITAGPKVSSIEADIKVFRTWDPKTGKYIDKIGVFKGDSEKVTIIGMNVAGDFRVPKASLVFDEPGVNSELVGSYFYGASKSPVLARPVYREVVTTDAGSVIAGVQTGKLAPIMTSGGGSNVVPLMAGGSVLLSSTIPELGNKGIESSNLRTEVLSKEIQGVASIPRSITEVIEDAGTETIQDVSQAQGYITAVESAQETLTDQGTSSTEMVGEVPVQLPTSIIPGSPFAGIRSPMPVFGFPGGGWRLRTSKKKPFPGIYKGSSTLNPLADWRVYFKRKFGYYGIPGLTRKIEIYNPKDKDTSDVGNVSKKLKLLTSPKLPNFIENRKRGFKI